MFSLGGCRRKPYLNYLAGLAASVTRHVEGYTAKGAVAEAEAEEVVDDRLGTGVTFQEPRVLSFLFSLSESASDS